MPADGRARRTRRRVVALVAVAVLLALTGFSWWLSGRWLARPERRPDAPPGGRAGEPSPAPATPRLRQEDTRFTRVYPR